MDKGDRVKITGGRKGVGTCGTIFWVGDDRYNPGKRFGLRGDDGETYWISEELVEPADAPPPSEDEIPTYEKGDRVRFPKGDEHGTGEVFWTGDNKYGPGQRLGIRDDAPEGEDDAVWMDSRLVEALAEGSAAPAAPQAVAPTAATPDLPDDGPPEPPMPVDETWEAPASADDLPEGPPLDDPALDRWAASVPDEDEVEGIPSDYVPADD